MRILEEKLKHKIYTQFKINDFASQDYITKIAN